MGIKLSRKNIERFIKKARGKDVPALDGVEIPQEIVDLLAAGQEFGVKYALAAVDDAAQGIIKNQSLSGVPAEIFAACVDAIKSQIAAALED